MPSVYFPDNFIGRVNYAAATIVRGGRHTRHFDSCFEMYDGDLVVTALCRRAEDNPRLHAAISRDWGGKFPQSWLETAWQYALVPTRQLGQRAAQMREDHRRQHAEWLEQQRQKDERA